MKNIFCCITIIISAAITSCRQHGQDAGSFVVISGDYFGQATPGDSARLFAPGIISTGMAERDFAITPDGNEIFFCREAGNFRFVTIFYSRRSNGVWSVPEVFEYCTNPAYKYVEPHISPDGNRLYFISTMPADSSSAGNEDIWVCTRTDGKWSEPRNPGAPLNSASKEFFPSVTVDGTVYFTHLDTVACEEFIYRSRLADGVYLQPEKLGPNVNIGRARYNAFIAPDESYIIIPAYGMPDSYGATDYYISFRDKLDNWSKPVNMGPRVNSSSQREWSASVSTDGKYIFFMSDRPGGTGPAKLSTETLLDFHNSPQNGNPDIYWVGSALIERLRKNAY
jgi:hypothetical protein